MRSACYIFVNCALLAGFIEAPFAHFHEHGDGDEHHATQQTHAHLAHSPRSPAGAALDQLDPVDDERLVNWFRTIQHSPFVLVLAPASAGIIEPPAEAEFIRSAPSIRNHDPPSVASVPSRAPPRIPA